MEAKKEGRPGMLGGVLQIFDRDESRIPDRIRVSFSDGTTAVYDLHTDQPAPLIMENIRIIRKWRTGYQYREDGRRAPRRRRRA